MVLARHQDRIVCIKSSFIWDCQEFCADTCLKKIAHFFLIYNGFLLPVLPGRSIQHERKAFSAKKRLEGETFERLL